MTETTEPRAKLIEHKIYEAIDGEDVEDVLSALCNMLTQASQIAAKYPERQSEHQH